MSEIMAKQTLMSTTVRISQYVKIFGFATCTVKSFDDERVHVSRTDAILLIANLTFSFLMIYSTILYGLNYLIGKSLMQYVAFCVMISSSLVCFISILCSFCFRNKIWGLVKIMQRIDDNFESLNVDTEPKGFKSYILIGIGFFVTMIFIGIFNMAYLFEYYNRPSILIHFLYLSFSFSFVMSWMILFHVGVYRRFMLMNMKLK